MGMTITEKILARASGLAKVSPGNVTVVDVETACLIDLSFLPEGWRKVLKVADPSKVVIVFDHLVPAPTAQAAACMQTGRAFAREFGIQRLHDVGADQGISHAVIADKAYALPGTVLVNADSHTCSAGAFNCAARGVGGPDMLYAVATGKAWFRVGETIRMTSPAHSVPACPPRTYSSPSRAGGAHMSIRTSNTADPASPA
jgi:3-isopropylmalate/(R)-2-methylmalate dehydratase large subunit